MKTEAPERVALLEMRELLQRESVALEAAAATLGADAAARHAHAQRVARHEQALQGYRVAVAAFEARYGPLP